MRLGVRIVYRNDKLEPVFEKCCDFQEYTASIRNDLLRIITDVEDMIYCVFDGKSKDEWPDDVWTTFCKIKHKILDKAGDIGRLPENMITKEDEHGSHCMGQERRHSECDENHSAHCAEKHERFSSSVND